MTDLQSPYSSPAAPHPSHPSASTAQPQQPGLLGRLGRLLGSKPKVSADPAYDLRQSLSAKLPATDPLRAARLQTHLFLGQLPPFPMLEGMPLTPPVPHPPFGGQAYDSPTPQSQQQTQDQEAGLAALRAEKQSRKAAKAQAEARAAQDPARQRVETLRQRRQRDLRAGERRPASAPVRGSAQSTSRATQAAAARTPARVALSQVATGSAPNLTRRAGGGGRNLALNALLLLLLLVTLALVFAGAMWGYNWYQSQTSGSGIEPPSTDLFDNNAGNVGALDPGAVRPSGNPLANNDPGSAVPTTAQGGAATGGDNQVADGIRQTTVLLLEQELNRQNFLNDARDVDGEYTMATMSALRSFANTTVNSTLGTQVLDAGLQPTQEQLEAWQSVLDATF